jgi:Cu/Ag efflux pump CusA
VAPTFRIDPMHGVACPIFAQTPQFWFDSVSALTNVPSSKHDASQILEGLATIKRGVTPALVSHYAVQPVIGIYASNFERDLDAVSRDIQRIIDGAAKVAPPCATVVLRDQTETMYSTDWQ